MIEPTLTMHGSSVAFTWLDSPLKMVLSRFRDSSRGSDAEIQVLAANGDGAGLITSAKINLQSLSTRKKFAQELTSLTPGSKTDWLTMVQQCCILGLRAHRAGEPVVLLQPQEQANVPLLLDPFIFEKHQTLIYAPGGLCKSYLALYLALVACHGGTHNGFTAHRCPVLYLDWELDAFTIGTRLTRLHRGHPELSRHPPFYRACSSPLHEEADIISEEIAKKNIRLVIIDSAIMACGDDMNSTQAPKQLQRALRQMGCASLVLSHVAKNTEEKTAYGNVFFQNLCRNQYQAQLVDESDQHKRITLTNTKINFGAFQPLKGVAFDFNNNACRVSTFNPEQEDACQDKLPLPSRIRNLLDDGEPRSAMEISEELNVKPSTLKPILSKHRGIKWVMVGENRSAQWTVLNR
jgi:hypothetical protein